MHFFWKKPPNRIEKGVMVPRSGILSSDTEILKKQNKALNLKGFSICLNYQNPAYAPQLFQNSFEKSS